MNRIWHHYETWECVLAGMYDLTARDGTSKDDALRMYADFLSDTERFKAALGRVLAEWPVSCEQFLSNEGFNRIAWLGQASMTIATGIPAAYRAGFKLLTEREQAIANEVAALALYKWVGGRSDDGGQLCLSLND